MRRSGELCAYCNDNNATTRWFDRPACAFCVNDADRKADQQCERDEQWREDFRLHRFLRTEK